MPFTALARRDPLVVLGVDPGTFALGYGVVGRSGRCLRAVDHGALLASHSEPLEQRLLRLSRLVGKLLDHHQPDVVALEEAFFGKNVQSALRIGEARSVVIVAATERGIPVVPYPTATVKKAVCGHGGAPKSVIAEMVATQLGLREAPEPHDAADALALALCFLGDPRLLTAALGA